MSEPDKLVTQADIDAVESELLKKRSEETAKLIKEAEERVRKEMEAKMEAEKLKEKLAAMEAENKKIRDEQEIKLKASQEAFEKRLMELESQKRGVTQNTNPFQQTNFQSQSAPMDPRFVRTIDGRQVDVSRDLDHKAIEEQSRLALMKAWGIQNPEWGLPPKN